MLKRLKQQRYAAQVEMHMIEAELDEIDPAVHWNNSTVTTLIERHRIAQMDVEYFQQQIDAAGPEDDDVVEACKRFAEAIEKNMKDDPMHPDWEECNGPGGYKWARLKK